ncbi:MSMEG_0570 family nitrogen starvation response protein [Pseudonocardia xinjiangensis]|uniref:MSMEG_0570 family nitrogen starvation response protein n=2 Tax=Pseudonocardia xinjiangensis TaxID=75289 RepID=A0ABX1RPZ9_9PSEU|nr:MSMEG_0570 family nitrogen starvation response protein [Pseudonocardia xinjiangensis]
MPEMTFEIRWPDGSARHYYSPSLVVEEYLTAGESYPVEEFVRRSREALGIAGERVRAKYGFPCSRAAASLAAIEQTAAGFADGSVRVERLTR